MFYYKAFGLNIYSEVELPGMIEIEQENEFQVKIILKEVNIPEHDINGPNYLADGKDVYLWWDGIGKVGISRGEEIVIDPSSNIINTDEAGIIPFLLGPVMSILLYQRGFLVLHGSSINVDNGAIAFLGHRGLGKSTTAINLYRKGYPLVTDDILAVRFDEEGSPLIYPGYPHARLSDESYAEIKDNTSILTPIRTYAGKLFCDASRGFSPEPIKLKRIYILEDGEEAGISNFKPQENLINLLIHSTANRVMQDYDDQANNLTQCAHLIKNASIRRLEISHSFKNLPDLVSMVEDDFKVEITGED